MRCLCVLCRWRNHKQLPAWNQPYPPGAGPLLVGARWWIPGNSCWQQAVHTRFDAQYLSSLAMASRPLPAFTGTTDWPQGHLASAAALQNRTLCIGPRLFDTAQSALHYKVINRTIFIEHGHHFHDFPAAKYRKVFDEQLAIAVWLYRDFPDVDLFVWFGDMTGGCPLDIPWLQYSATDTPGGTSTMDFNLAEFIIPLSSSPGLAGNPHMRGYAVPTPDEWQMAMSEQQLQGFVQCINAQFPWSSKAADVIWRGRDSGGPGRWTAAEQSTFMQQHLGMDAAAASRSRSTSLANKRIALAAAAAAARTASTGQPRLLDVALAGQRYLAASDPPGQLVQQQLMGSYVPFVPDWAGHMFSLSIDGFGPPFRLPQQLLLGTVVLKMASPMKEHFWNDLVEGQHFIGFNYNISNFVQVATEAVHAARQEQGNIIGVRRFEEIASAAQQFAVQHFSLLAQQDALMAAILGVKKHSPWKVIIPEGEKEQWVPIGSRAGRLKLRTHALPEAVKRQVLGWHRSRHAYLQQ